jgi:hypothetical protein
MWFEAAEPVLCKQADPVLFKRADPVLCKRDDPVLCNRLAAEVSVSFMYEGRVLQEFEGDSALAARGRTLRMLVLPLLCTHTAGMLTILKIRVAHCTEWRHGRHALCRLSLVGSRSNVPHVSGLCTDVAPNIHKHVTMHTREEILRENSERVYVCARRRRHTMLLFSMAETSGATLTLQAMDVDGVVRRDDVVLLSSATGVRGMLLRNGGASGLTCVGGTHRDLSREGDPSPSAPPSSGLQCSSPLASSCSSSSSSPPCLRSSSAVPPETPAVSFAAMVREDNPSA